MGLELPDYVERYITYCKNRGFTLIGAFSLRESGYKEVGDPDYGELNMYFVSEKNQYQFVDAYKNYKE